MRLLPEPRPDSLLAHLHSPNPLHWQIVTGRLWIVAFIAVPLLQGQPLSTWLLPTALSLPVYLYLHTRVYVGPYRRLAWYAAGMAALGLALLPCNDLAWGYVFSAGICFANLQSWRRWLAGVGLMSVPVALVAAWLQVSPWPLLALLALLLLSGFGHFQRMSALRKAAQLRLTQDEVRRLAVLAERERIGRDLHDLLGHTLSLVTLKSELARKLALADPPRAQREMEEVERVSRHALAEVRAAVTGMRRSDLAAELVSARLMLEASGIAFEADAPATCDLSPDAEASLALVLREAVTNIHRHARATAARVVFSSNPESFHMRISDNGRGGLAAHGNGISGMRERVRALGGALAIDSPARRGTTLDVEVPQGAAGKPAATGAHVASPVLAGQEGAA
jgi:two-component system sensor histidine kinase DesK